MRRSFNFLYAVMFIVSGFLCYHFNNLWPFIIASIVLVSVDENWSRR